MKKIRVLVASQPRLMREVILTAIGDQPDIDVVGESDDEATVSRDIERTHPDFLFLALKDPETQPELCGLLLPRYPALRILAVAPEYDCGVFYWGGRGIRSRKVESSEAAILRLLRSECTRPASETVVAR